MGEPRVIRPSRSDHVEIAVGMQVHQRKICRDLAKAIGYWRDIIDAVVLDRLAQLLEPFRAGFLIACASIRIGSKASSVRRTTFPSAPEDVSICSKAGQMRWASAITPSAAAVGSARTTARFSVLADFSRSIALADDFQLYAPACMPGLNAHPCVTLLTIYSVPAMRSSLAEGFALSNAAHSRPGSSARPICSFHVRLRTVIKITVEIRATSA
jgi:hypothetical protein